MTYTNLTLGELLSSDNETIKRHAVGILKQLQKNYKIKGNDCNLGGDARHCDDCVYGCEYCFNPITGNCEIRKDNA